MNTVERIFDLIDKKGITAKTLSLATGISQGNISDWKKGRKVNPSLEALTKIADYFNVSTDYLLCKTDSINAIVSIEEEVAEDVPTPGKGEIIFNVKGFGGSDDETVTISVEDWEKIRPLAKDFEQRHKAKQEQAKRNNKRK